MTIYIKRFRPRATPVSAVQCGGKMADLHSIAAWIFENDGTAWIESGYADQGPDILNFRNKDEDITMTLPQGMWLVLHPNGRLDSMTDAAFQLKYEIIEERDRI